MNEQEKAYNDLKWLLASGFVSELDRLSPPEKMCVSNMEYMDIERAFNENDWCKLLRYAKKYCPNKFEIETNNKQLNN